MSFLLYFRLFSIALWADMFFGYINIIHHCILLYSIIVADFFIFWLTENLYHTALSGITNKVIFRIKHSIDILCTFRTFSCVYIRTNLRRDLQKQIVYTFLHQHCGFRYRILFVRRVIRPCVTGGYAKKKCETQVVIINKKYES